MAWTVNISYDDKNYFLTDKGTITGALNATIDYLKTFINGNGALNLVVVVEQTPTGRFGGNGEFTYVGQGDGVKYWMSTAAKDLSTGGNVNPNGRDIWVSIDPSGSYFKQLSWDTNPYTAQRSVPAGMTDGQTVLLHEIMHGLGFNMYRDYASGTYTHDGRTMLDKYTVIENGRAYFNGPSLAAHGIAPVLITNDSSSQNWAHLSRKDTLDMGYVDDIMNGLAFYTGQRYYMSQLDLIMLQDLGYSVNIPETLPVSYNQLAGKDYVMPTAVAGGTTSDGRLQLTGTAAAGAMTSVLEHGKLLGTTTADAQGKWSLDVATDAAQSVLNLVVRDGTHVLDTSLVKGSAGNDMITALNRSATVDGGAGTDSVAIAAARASVTATRDGAGLKLAGGGYTATVTNVERVVFNDSVLALDVDKAGIAGQAYRVYQAAFNRTPDAGGVGFWIGMMDKGLSLHDVAQGFVDSQEFKTLYGANASNRDILTKMYDNVLHRAPDPAGFDFYLGLLDKKTISTTDLLEDMSQSAENLQAVATIIGNGFNYTPYLG